MKNKHGFLGWVSMGCGTYQLVDRYGHVYSKYWDDEGEIYYCFMDEDKKIQTKTYYWGSEAQYISTPEMLNYVIENATYPFDIEADKYYNQVNLMQRRGTYHSAKWGFEDKKYFDEEGFKAWNKIWEYQDKVKNLKSLEEFAGLELPNIPKIILTLCDD